MAAAKEAAALGAKVVLFDSVKPSTQGTTWGLGGTCVNAGCVPKKLMHYAGLLGAAQHDAVKFGWEVSEHAKHDWARLLDTVNNHVRMLNFSYKRGLRSAGVQYLSALASLVDAHTVEYTQKGAKHTLTAKHILLAVGGRPHVPADVPGALELAITSDDLFWRAEPPGETLCVGAGYVSLECAGFLNELGFKVAVAVRSMLLRGFDRQRAGMVGEVMEAQGVEFLQGLLPAALERTAAGRIAVHFGPGQPVREFDTVLYATGRAADTQGLGLTAAGVQTTPTGKLVVDGSDCTSVPSVFAIGDAVAGRLELTPVAIKTGELLARRLFAGATAKLGDRVVPTAVFTPAEYGAIGMSEEAAYAKYGPDNVEVYLQRFSTLELAAAHRVKAPSQRADQYDVDAPLPCLAKLICLKSEGERVIGLHFVGPNAGEVTQGFTLALTLGATKAHFDDMIGIHPTDAEVFAGLHITRASGLDFQAVGGCGGGKCG